MVRDVYPVEDELMNAGQRGYGLPWRGEGCASVFSDESVVLVVVVVLVAGGTGVTEGEEEASAGPCGDVEHRSVRALFVSGG